VVPADAVWVKDRVVAGHEADVELLGVERPYEALTPRLVRSPRSWRTLSVTTFDERREESRRRLKVLPAVALELAERQRAGLLDTVLRALVGQRGVGVAQAQAELGEELAEPHA